MANIYRKIYKKIKKYHHIVIARHIGADPDALASQMGLRDCILHTFPQKKAYAVGCPSSKFKYVGSLDKMPDIDFGKSLLIVLDTPDRKRIDGVDPSMFSEVIKIDHHPFVDKISHLEWIDDTASSTSQLILELIFHTPLQLNKEVAMKLYMGIVSDTNRFLFRYTSAKTFALISWLLEKTDIDFHCLYDNLYMRSFSEIQFQGYLLSHLEVTKSGFGYVKITDDILQKYNVDAATAGNMVDRFNYIAEVYAWGFFAEDIKHENIRGYIRSRGPIINDIASDFHGGGHIYASGARFESFDEVDVFIERLEERCKSYGEEDML